MPKRNESNPARLRGRIERVYYAGPKFSAGRLLTPTGEEVQFAGNLFARENQPVVLLGSWSTHPKYGRQFKVDGMEHDLELDPEGLIHYLANHPEIKGIGPAKARLIVESFGDAFEETLLNDPERIALKARLPLDAARRLWEPERVFIYGADAPEDIAKLLKGLVPGKTIGFEARAVTLEFYEKFAETLAGSGCRLSKADGLVERLRVIKDTEEIRRMEISCRLNQQMMEWLPGVLVPGRSEAAVSWDIEMFFRHHGATELAFTSIVGHGPNAALPHYLPSKDALLEAENLVLVDVGCRLEDYCSDQTRTFWVGEKPTERFKKTLEAVQEAQHKAIRAIHPGVLACDVYKAARGHFESLGVAEAFTHGLGHGVGLETHEGPSLNGRNKTPLEPGMIVTVEPGLYFPEWGGIRWEHMVLVTEDGCRVL